MLPLDVEAQFKAELNSLLDLGIIVHSQSSWCSPPIPVKKKDGTIHIVVDFCKLNTITVAEPFYMPSTEEEIARLGATKYLSKVDLAKGFHQISMSCFLLQVWKI